LDVARLGLLTAGYWTPDSRVLLQGRIAHAEAGAEVFRQQFDGGPIALRIRLGEILHGLHQDALSFHITRVWLAFSLAVDRG
jgi:hypothetical protein